MEVTELKFLLKLVGKPDYKAKIAELKPNSKTKVSETEKICRGLRDRKLLLCSEEMTKIKLASPGKSLLKSDITGLPISSDELKIIKACEKGIISPSETKVTPAKKRQELIESLIQRGLIEVANTKLTEAWLTEKGKDYLANEYNPKGTSSVLSLDLLNNYLSFLRKYLFSSQSPQQVSTVKPSDERILEAIANLDRELKTNNYLPIFHLRQKFQPPLSRDELDKALYRLQEQDKIELSTLADVSEYSLEEINAGIPQLVGGSLFFIILNQ